MKRTSLGILVAAILAGCGGEEFTSASALQAEPDAQADSPQSDSQVDAKVDAKVDVPPNDVVQPEASPDSAPDAQPDAGPDTGPDAEPDAGQDAQQDTQPEADAGQPDSGPEPQPEAGQDAQPEADASQPDSGPDAQPDVGQDAQPEPQPEAGQDAQPEADAQADAGDANTEADAPACVEGARKCIGPVSPGICSGGKWIGNGGMCNFGCTGEGVCRCTYVNDPWIQTLVTVVNKPGAGCGSEIGIPNVEIDGMLYMPVQACGVDATQVISYPVSGTVGPYAVVPSFDNMENLMVQRAPVTMTQCEDGAPFYAFERTYFTRSTAVSNCFWTSTTVGAWRKVILADGTVTQKPKTDLCQYIPQYYPY